MTMTVTGTVTIGMLALTTGHDGSKCRSACTDEDAGAIIED